MKIIIRFKYGDNWCDEFNIIPKSINRPLLPVMVPRFLEMYGKDGIFDYGENRVSTRIISIECSVSANNINDLRLKAREIATWLYNDQPAKLIFEDEAMKYYYARVYSQIDFENITRHGKFSIEFECQPWAFFIYSTQELDDITWNDAEFPWEDAEFPWDGSDSYIATGITSETNLTFYNPGTKITDCKSSQGAKSIFTLSGNADEIVLTLNGKSLTFTDLDSFTLIIDMIEMTATIAGSNQLHKMSGDLDTFLPINPGENTLNINGTNLNLSTLSIDFIPEFN